MIATTSKPIIEHLKEITDEVAQLHPILEQLFRKLPLIERVHYNQGNNEIGADFILYRRDPALMRTTNIGVVVKKDKIGQNTTDVERQIKECFVLRKAVDTTEVQIREVWVVSSQEISRNAREVLNKQYSDKKIEFIAAQDLAGMINEFLPDVFQHVSPAFKEYSDQLHQDLASDDRRSLIISGMENFYVDPDIHSIEFDPYGKQSGSKKLSSLEELRHRICSGGLSIIEASAGGGKSRIARELIRHLLASDDFKNGSISPFYGHMKDYSTGVASKCLKQAADIRTKLKNQKIHIAAFLDGFDEINVDDNARQVIIQELLQATAGENNISFILLSRPFSQSKLFGTRASAIDVYKIIPLKGQKAISFLSNVAGQIDVKTKVIKDLNKSLILRALEGAPIAYILLGRLIAENQQDLPSNLTELYQKYTELVLGRWEITKGLRSQQEYEVLVEMLTWMATYVLDNKLQELSRTEVSKWLNDYCSIRPIKIDTASLIDRVTARNSILYARSDFETLGFRHRAFAEFFYARSMHRKNNVNIAPEVFSPYWINSFFFLAGFKRDCPELLQSLSDLALPDEPHRLMRIFNFGHFLLAGYMTPVDVAQKAILEIARDAAAMYLQACDPESRSQLSSFPTIQLLALFNTIFKDQYGYEFFRNGLEEAIFEIEGGSRTQADAVALLFLDVAYKEAGGDLRFDEAIRVYGDSLPLVVKLAMKHEAHTFNCVTDRVKKMERNLRRAFASRFGENEFLKKIYKTPIKKLEKKLTDT